MPRGTISITLFSVTPSNTPLSIASGVCQWTVTDLSPVQPEKVPGLILVTLLGILIEVSPVQPEKVYHPIIVTLLGISIEVSPLQPEKAPISSERTPKLSPILVTLLGILIEVSPLQPEKVPYSILVISRLGS